MKSFVIFAAAVFAAFAAPLAAADGAEGHAWGYSTANASVASPAQWATYYPACGGNRQSPININTETSKGSSSALPLTFSGSCSDYTLTQSHEAYKGSVVGGSCAIKANNVNYNLLQFHLHTPSEHTLNGKALDGEAHFVHSNADGSALAVVGLFFQASKNAKTDAFFTNLLAGIDKVTETTSVNLSLSSYSELLKKYAKGSRVYNYPGSLTTPACSEIVDWWVIQEPLQIATADLQRLAKHFKEFAIYDNGKNARPVLPLNSRTVTKYSA